MAVLGVLKPRPTSFTHLLPPFPALLVLPPCFLLFWKTCGCFWKARSLWTVNSVAMIAVCWAIGRSWRRWCIFRRSSLKSRYASPPACNPQSRIHGELCAKRLAHGSSRQLPALNPLGILNFKMRLLRSLDRAQMTGLLAFKWYFVSSSTDWPDYRCSCQQILYPSAM
jgi:hypothetical protein